MTRDYEYLVFEVELKNVRCEEGYIKTVCQELHKAMREFGLNDEEVKVELVERKEIV